MTGPTLRKNRWWLYGILVLALGWYGFLAVLGPRRSPRLVNSGMSEKAPYDWSLKDLDDQPVSFQSFRGRTVFLNIWATWCGPCREEMPSIARLANDPRIVRQKIAFVCASTDDDAGVVKDYLAGKDWPMTFLRVERLPATFMSEGIPATFIIDPNGKIVATEIGSAAWDEPAVIELMEKAAMTTAVE